MNLAKYAKNVYSQCGEDGILAKLIEVLDPPRFCVEFGAGDGQEYSNTAALRDSWECLFIEGDPAKAAECCKRDSRTLCETVGWEGYSRLDAILDRRGTHPKDMGILSIDVDGNDWHIWEAIRQYRARIVVVEFNPTFPPWVSYLQPADPDINRGCSLRALVQLGHIKDYELVAVTTFNAIFVRGEDFAALGIADNSLESLWTFRAAIGGAAWGYDGKEIPWGNQGPLWQAEGGRYKHALRRE